MKSLAKYLFFAAMAVFALASCEKEKENPQLNPSGTPVKFTLTSQVLSETEAELKVTSDAPVTANISITLALDATNSTMKAANLSFPTELYLEKGKSEVTGKLSVDLSTLDAGKELKAIIIASISGVAFGSVEAISITTPPAPYVPKPDADGFTADGDPSEWAEMDHVVSLECVDGAALSGLKSAKIHYGKNLHFLLEVTDEALAKGVADGKLRLHIFLDGDNKAEDGFMHKWDAPAIDYMLEGKMTADGEYCSFSSNYQKWDGATPDEWKWADSKVEAKIIDSAGQENFYELTLDYSKYPDGLGKVINVGIDIADGAYQVMGFLPNDSVDAVCPMAQVVKSDYIFPDADGFTADGKDTEWKEIKEEDLLIIKSEEKAPVDGLKSAKAFYGKNRLHFLLELSKEAAAADKLILNVLFNGDNNDEGGLAYKWDSPDIDYMLSAVILDGGKFLPFDSPYYKWANVDYPSDWAWNTTDVKPVIEGAGNGTLYELSIDYSSYPGGLADPFSFGLSINDGSQEVLGYLPNSENEEEPASKPEITKNLTGGPGGGEPEPEGIKIDGEFDDWEDIEGISAGNYGMFKVASDEDNIYFFSWRNTGGRYEQLWGEEAGYIYIAFELDGDDTTGETLNSNGPYDYISYFYCFGGSPEEPVIEITAEGGVAPDTCTLEHLQIKGVVSEDGARIEYSIPRADLPEIPATQITVYSWGNKDLTKVSLDCVL